MSTTSKRAPSLWVHPPKYGTKAIYLPNFVLTLLRTPFLPPKYATFIAPLHLNKLDIKDYLYHAYDVRCLSVRSYVQHMKVRQDKFSAKNRKPRRWTRPRGFKRFTVEMEKAFVWPDAPEDFSPWDKETHEAAKEEQKREQAKLMPDAVQKPAQDRESIAEQAQALLKGKEKWRPTWVDYGAALGVDGESRAPLR